MLNDYLYGIYGTSASTPVFAAMVSLVNAKRLAAGKGSLGWLNPSLYTYYRQIILNDVTSGFNNCVVDATVCCSQGFRAAPGWDPLTGLGSINFGNFESQFFQLGDSLNQPTPSPVSAPGEPSNYPVSPPAGYPTFMPTVLGPANSGWIYVTNYTETDCQGTVATVMGVAAGLCSISYNTNNVAEGSVMYYQPGGLTSEFFILN